MTAGVLAGGGTAAGENSSDVVMSRRTVDLSGETDTSVTAIKTSVEL